MVPLLWDSAVARDELGPHGSIIQVCARRLIATHGPTAFKPAEYQAATSSASTPCRHHGRSAVSSSGRRKLAVKERPRRRDPADLEYSVPRIRSIEPPGQSDAKMPVYRDTYPMPDGRQLSNRGARCQPRRISLSQAVQTVAGSAGHPVLPGDSVRSPSPSFTGLAQPRSGSNRRTVPIHPPTSRLPMQNEMPVRRTKSKPPNGVKIENHPRNRWGGSRSQFLVPAERIKVNRLGAISTCLVRLWFEFIVRLIDASEQTVARQVQTRPWHVIWITRRRLSLPSFR